MKYLRAVAARGHDEGRLESKLPVQEKLAQWVWSPESCHKDLRKWSPEVLAVALESPLEWGGLILPEPHGAVGFPSAAFPVEVDAPSVGLRSP